MQHLHMQETEEEGEEEMDDDLRSTPSSFSVCVCVWVRLTCNARTTGEDDLLPTWEGVPKGPLVPF